MRHPFSRRIHRRSRLRCLLAAAAFLCTAYPFQAFPVSAETDSPLPAVYLQTGAVIGDEYAPAYVTIKNADGTEDLSDGAVSVRLRGNSSRRTPKKSYKLHFTNKANPLQLGDGKAKTWALVGNTFDASLLRNWTAMQISEKCSALSYTPNCRSVELYLNEQYSGVYLLIETVSVNKHRVKITEQPDEIENTGYLLEMTNYAEEPRFFADCFPFEIKSSLSAENDIAQQQIAYISGYTEAALHALQSGDEKATSAYIDIASLVDNCLVNEVCKNVDAGWDSYYLSKDAGGKLTFGPVWDFDIAFGNCGYPVTYQTAEGEGIFSLSDATQDANPWLCYAMRCDWFRKLLKARWEELLPELQTIPDAIMSEAAAHTEAYENNFTKLNNHIAPFLPYPDGSFDCYTQAAQAEILAMWLNTRLSWLDTYYHSAEFDAGIFPNEYGDAMPLQNELVAAILADLTPGDTPYQIPDMTYTARSGEWIVRMSNLMLAKGQTYRLSFGYQCTSGTSEITCELSGLNASAETISASFTGTTEQQQAEFLFTPSVTTIPASLLIQATGGGKITVSDLSLEKVTGQEVTGDLNRDGRCDGADARLLLRFLLGDAAEPANPKAADMNHDGRLDARDLTLLKRLLIA